MKIAEFFRLSHRRKDMLLLAVLVASQLAGGLAIYYVSIAQSKAALERVLQRAQADIRFTEDNRWEITRYGADPELLGPYRMYLFSSGGSVVDRRRPIAGFLDSSDFRQLSRYAEPQTVRTIANQTWRVYAQSVAGKVGRAGVVVVSQPVQNESEVGAADQKLRQAADMIQGKIKVSGNVMDVSSFDSRTGAPGVSFQVVSQYGQVLARNLVTSVSEQGPDFIATTYVLEGMGRTSARQVTDAETGERFLVASRSIVDKQGAQRGIVVAGRTLAGMYLSLRVLAVTSLIIDVIALVGLCLPLLVKKFRAKPDNDQAAERQTLPLAIREIRHIRFIKEESVLQINEHTIPLTYATNQYYLCTAVLLSRKRRWETDELIEKFGERHSQDSWRKVYDAMVSLNRKTAPIMETKLVINSNKTFQLNPELIDKVR